LNYYQLNFFPYSTHSDPGFVGETMSMPLDPEPIQKARDAGIIKDSNSPYNSISRSGSIDLGTPVSGMKYDDAGTMDLTAQAGQSLNVTGDWALDLICIQREPIQPTRQMAIQWSGDIAGTAPSGILIMPASSTAPVSDTN
jgi:hypothetical protein